MKRILIILLCIIFLAIPVQAIQIQPPPAPEFAMEWMPSDPQNLTEGLRQILRQALMYLRPDLKEAGAVCMQILAVAMLVSLLRCIPNANANVLELGGVIGVSLILLGSSNSMIRLGQQVITEMSEYGKLLLPVMTGALAAQGGVTSSAAMYGGTVLFDTLLTSMICKFLIPMLYLFLALSVAVGATGENLISGFLGLAKWFMTWILKTILYVFTGYMGITGVVSGTTDAAALKAAKLTISSVVPVVGGILSDASEAVLVSAGTVKNAVGLYGLFAVLAIWISPFLKIGAHYLLLKGAGALCAVFGSKRVTTVVEQFAAAMGYLLAMSGAVCLLLMVSTVCFMRGAA